MLDYQVIIIGGGPVGIALGIELGMQGIKAAIVEKHGAPLLSPRAQTLNPRTLEFFRRWGCHDALLQQKLLPKDFPMRGIWCSALNGDVYATTELGNAVNATQSPDVYHRIPLWITEEVLRERLKAFPSVTLFTHHELIDLQQDHKACHVTVKNRKTNANANLTAHFVVGCDGANSLTRELAGIKMQSYLPPTKMINITYQSTDLKNKITVPLAFFYFILNEHAICGLGCTDYFNSTWYAAMSYQGEENIEKVDASALLDIVVGFPFDKKILQQNFWEMQAGIADYFIDGKIILAGDAAHILPPTGGYGLNTGFADAVNLGWKLATILKNGARDYLLESYERERRPVGLNNLLTAKQNADDLYEIRQLHSVEKDLAAFIAANTQATERHGSSIGIALGYCYDPTTKFTPSEYEPKALKGYFAPHIMYPDHKTLYDILTPTFTLLYQADGSDSEIQTIQERFKKHEIILITHVLPQNTLYKQKYYLLRPDWHILFAGTEIPDYQTIFGELAL